MDVIEACQGQLRTSWGGVVGIDLVAALRVAELRGYDLAVMVELLPAAEAGLVDACDAYAARHRPPEAE